MAVVALRRRIRDLRWMRSPAVKRQVRRVIAARIRLLGPLLRMVRLESLPAELATHLAYEVLLQRGADVVGLETYVPGLLSGSSTRSEMVQWVRGSSECETHHPLPPVLAPSLHASRCRFIRALPRARSIVDLGGVSAGDRRGALVASGYPYDFDSLVIVDLPSDERHELYRTDEEPDRFVTEQGPVTYRYHSMVDLSAIPDASTDLVYSGQSIEHVSPADAVTVLREVARILRPGGRLALDTPNGRVTRLQQDEFIDPDHEVEYTWAELRTLLEQVGFVVEWAKGLNYAGRSLDAGVFDTAEVAGNCGLYDEIADCYVLAVVATRPQVPGPGGGHPSPSPARLRSRSGTSPPS